MEIPEELNPSWLAQYARERGNETFRRMWLLEQRGYFRETKLAFQGEAISLEPYADNLPRIFLYPDGTVVGYGRNRPAIYPDGPEGERDRINNYDDEDVEVFDRWIAQIPMPNMWQDTVVPLPAK